MLVNCANKKHSAPVHQNAPHVHMYACFFRAHPQRKFVDKNVPFILVGRKSPVSLSYPCQEPALENNACPVHFHMVRVLYHLTFLVPLSLFFHVPVCMSQIPLCSVCHMSSFVLSFLLLGILSHALYLCVVSCTAKTHSCTISMINYGRNLSNGGVVAIILILSFTVLNIFRFLVRVCCPMHSVIPFCSINCCICLNCLSTNTDCTLNPQL